MQAQRASVAIPLCRTTGRILLLRRKAPRDETCPQRWEAPGGKANDIESDEVAASRELFEETRLNQPIVANLGTLPVWQPGPVLLLVTFTVAVMEREFVPRFPKGGGEHDAYNWLAPEDVTAMVADILPFNIGPIYAAFALYRVHYWRT